MFDWFKKAVMRENERLEDENRQLQLEIGQLLAELHDARLKIVVLEERNDELEEMVKNLWEGAGNQ